MVFEVSHSQGQEGGKPVPDLEAVSASAFLVLAQGNEAHEAGGVLRARDSADSSKFPNESRGGAPDAVLRLSVELDGADGELELFEVVPPARGVGVETIGDRVDNGLLFGELGDDDVFGEEDEPCFGEQLEMNLEEADVGLALVHFGAVGGGQFDVERDVAVAEEEAPLDELLGVEGALLVGDLDDGEFDGVVKLGEGEEVDVGFGDFSPEVEDEELVELGVDGGVDDGGGEALPAEAEIELQFGSVLLEEIKKGAPLVDAKSDGAVGDAVWVDIGELLVVVIELGDFVEVFNVEDQVVDEVGVPE